MKVWLIYEGEYAEYNDAYCARLFEQRRAVPAIKMQMDGEQGRIWLKSLKYGMELAEERRKREEAADNLPPD